MGIPNKALKTETRRTYLSNCNQKLSMIMSSTGPWATLPPSMHFWHRNDNQNRNLNLGSEGNYYAANPWKFGNDNESAHIQPPPSTSWNTNNFDQLAARLLTIEGGPCLSPRIITTSTSRLSPANINMNINIFNFGHEELSLPSPIRNESSGNSSDPDTDIVRNSKFKTEICRNFKEKGKCIYENLCQFAHGNQDMRNICEPKKYKTRKCQNYWIKGYCAYGPRCNFLHYEDPDKVMPNSNNNIQYQDKYNNNNIQNQDRIVRRESAGELSGITTLSGSPPKSNAKLPTTPIPLEILHRPSFGSGRLGAYMKDGEVYWLDTRTQTFV